MKTFVISLERAKKRRISIQQQLNTHHLDFEMMNAVDGQNLTEDQMEELCDMEQVRKFPRWLTRGMIGASLSHRLAYERIVKEKLPYALILEDDVELPNNTLTLLDKIEPAIKSDEIIFLYYQSHGELLLSSNESETVGSSKLMHPMNASAPVSAAAYIIGNITAKNLLANILPIRVGPDSWGYFYSEGFIKSIRCLYPLQFKIKNFKSSIDYVDHSSWLGKLLNFIDVYSVPPFYQLITWRRKKRLDKMLVIKIVDDRSPVAKK